MQLESNYSAGQYLCYQMKVRKKLKGERSLNNLKHIIASGGALPRCNCEMKPQRWFLLWYTYGKAAWGGNDNGGCKKCPLPLMLLFVRNKTKTWETGTQNEK